MNYEHTRVLSVKWVKFQGVEYRFDCLVCVEVEIDLPVFYKIKKIFVKDERVFFVGEKLLTVCYNDHVNAFEVTAVPKSSFLVIEVCDLKYFRPFDIQMSLENDCKEFVVPYCVLLPL